MTTPHARLARLERLYADRPDQAPDRTDHKARLYDLLGLDPEATYPKGTPPPRSPAELAHYEGARAELAEIQAEAARLLAGGAYPPEVAARGWERGYADGLASRARSLRLLLHLMGEPADDLDPS